MSKTGYFEHWEREHLGENSKQSIFSKTIESYNKSIEQGNYSLGFLISSSLLEDRIKSLWVLVEWRALSEKLRPDCFRPNYGFPFLSILNEKGGHRKMMKIRSKKSQKSWI